MLYAEDYQDRGSSLEGEDKGGLRGPRVESSLFPRQQKPLFVQPAMLPTKRFDTNPPRAVWIIAIIHKGRFKVM